MNPRLRSLFPRGSKSFFQANETEADRKLQDSDSQRNQASALGGTIPRKEKSLERATVRYRICRVRSLDPDNAYASTKDCTDGLRRCGLIQGDDPTLITLEISQKKVDLFSQERLEIEIEWPEEKT